MQVLEFKSLMELNMTDNEMQRDNKENNKFSARMSIFAWVICAFFGWAIALTTLNSLTSSGNPKDGTLNAENAPNSEEAMMMENILPAAGKN